MAITVQPTNTAKAEESPKAVNTTQQDVVITTQDEDLDKEYIDKRSVTISSVHNYSNYRKVNMKVLGQRRENIGSSVTSCRTLSSNKEEVEAYFPALIGLSPNHPNFIDRVKAWLSNISMTVTSDVTLNTSFIYNHKRDYLAFAKKEDEINEEFDKVNKANLSAVKAALKRKCEALNTLESSKHKYGHPENIEEYLMYRHCLLYNDVAKDLSLINSDPTLRFYIKDEAKEAEKARKLLLERKKAMQNYIEVCGSDSKFNAVFVQLCVNQGYNVTEYNIKSREDKERILMNYATENPAKFNKLVMDKQVGTKAFIELLIARGELIRSEFNQQISTPDGNFIGSNINDAVAYFNNPEHKDIKVAYENKLKVL